MPKTKAVRFGSAEQKRARNILAGKIRAEVSARIKKYHKTLRANLELLRPLLTQAKEMVADLEKEIGINERELRQ